MQIAGVSHHLAIGNQSVQGCVYFSMDRLSCTIAEIWWLSDINMTFFEGKDVGWCLSQKIPGMMPETQANNPVMLYSEPHYSHFIDRQNADLAVFKLSKRTNLEIKDTACLHTVHILQHPTCRPTMKSMHTTMVNMPNKNLSPLLAGKYRKSTKWSTRRHYQANESKSGLEADRVLDLGEVCRLQSKKKPAA